MYNPYGFPPPWVMMPQGNNGEDSFTTYMKVAKFLEEDAAKKKEKEKKKHEPHRFTFLETLGICHVMLPIAGLGYYLLLKHIF